MSKSGVFKQLKQHTSTCLSSNKNLFIKHWDQKHTVGNQFSSGFVRSNIVLSCTFN